MTEREKQEFNRADSQDDSGPPLKRLRGGFTEPLVKSGGIQHFNISNTTALWQYCVGFLVCGVVLGVILLGKRPGCFTLCCLYGCLCSVSLPHFAAKCHISPKSAHFIKVQTIFRDINASKFENSDLRPLKYIMYNHILFVLICVEKPFEYRVIKSADFLNVLRHLCKLSSRNLPIIWMRFFHYPESAVCL